MILVFEVDLTIRDGKRWTWKPMFFKGKWGAGKTWRIAWGIFSVSYYPSKCLRKFFDRVKKGVWYHRSVR